MLAQYIYYNESEQIPETRSGIDKVGFANKRCAGFINYETSNYCTLCMLRVSKILYPLRCPQCNKKLKTRPRNKLRMYGKIDKRVRID